MRDDVARQDLRFAKRELRERGRVGDIVAARTAKGNVGVVTQRPDVLLAVDAHVGIDHDPAVLHCPRERLHERQWCVTDRGDDGLGVDAWADPGLDAGGRRRRDPGVQTDLDAAPAQLVGRIGGKVLWQFGKDPRTVLDQDGPDLVGSNVRVEFEGFSDQFLNLADRLDAGEPSADATKVRSDCLRVGSVVASASSRHPRT